MSPTFGLTIFPQLPIPQQVDLAVLAERLGFATAWWTDHLLMTDGSPAVDCWTVMAAAATRTRRIGLATGVSDPHRCSAASFAQRCATLDQLSRGRLLVGLGSGEAMNLDPFGIPWQDRKVGRMREFLTVLRGLWDSREPFDFEGDFQRFRRAHLAVRPWRDRRIPLYLAALGPQMQRLLGEMGDGWVPVSLPPQHYAEYFAPVAEAARAVGRSPESIARTAMLVVALLPEGVRVSRETVARVARPYAGTLVWEVAARRMGLPWDPPAELAGVSYATVDPCDPASMERFEAFNRWLPDEVLEAFVHYGDVARIVEVCRSYVRAGVTHFQVYNVSPDPVAALARFGTQVLPAVTGRPPSLQARLLARAIGGASRLGWTRRSVPPDLDLWKDAGI